MTLVRFQHIIVLVVNAHWVGLGCQHGRATWGHRSRLETAIGTSGAMNNSDILKFIKNSSKNHHRLFDEFLGFYRESLLFSKIIKKSSPQNSSKIHHVDFVIFLENLVQGPSRHVFFRTLPRSLPISRANARMCVSLSSVFANLLSVARVCRWWHCWLLFYAALADADAEDTVTMQELNRHI